LCASSEIFDPKDLLGVPTWKFASSSSTTSTISWREEKTISRAWNDLLGNMNAPYMLSIFPKLDWIIVPLPLIERLSGYLTEEV
jgi:hypothetical protein